MLPASSSSTIRLEYDDGKSRKFWQVSQEAERLFINWGRLGTDGQRQTKTLDDEEAATKERDKLVRSKLNKGYVEAKGSARPVTSKASASKKSATKTTSKKNGKKAPANKPYGEGGLKRFLADTVDLLREAKGSKKAEKEVIERYLGTGEEKEISSPELSDYFYISTPGLAERAGYTGKAFDAISDLFTATATQFDFSAWQAKQPEPPIDPQWTPQQLGRELCKAACDGKLARAKKLVEAGAKLETKGRDFLRPLHQAALNGHLDVMRFLIERGANVNAIAYSTTPLDEAVLRGQVEAVQLLLEAGASLESKRGPLLLRAKAPGIIKLLVKAGVDVHETDEDGRSALHEAAYWGFAPAVRTLLAAGADINASDLQGQTALHGAARQGSASLVELLLSRGATVDATNALGDTPLHEAAYATHTFHPSNVPEAVGEFVKTSRLLVEAGADPDARGSADRTALWIAACLGHEDVVRSLLELGANPKKGMGSKTPATGAKATKREEVVKILSGNVPKTSPRKTAASRRVEEPKAQSKAQKDAAYALCDAAESGSIPSMKRSLANGVSVDARGTLSRTPLHLAAEGGHAKAVTFLLQQGADVDAQDYRKHTPLEVAAQRGSLPIVEALLSHGAGAMAKNCFGDTPVDAATTPEVVQALVAAGGRVDAESALSSLVRKPYGVSAKDILRGARFLIELGVVPTASHIEQAEDPALEKLLVKTQRAMA